MKKINISVVVGRFYLKPESLEGHIKTFFKPLMGNINISSIIFVDMKNNTSHNTKNNISEEWINKSCYYLDFSAYKEIDKGDHHELFLYINDTLFVRRPWKVIANEIRKSVQTLVQLKVPAAIGDVASYDEVMVNDRKNSLNVHLTTYCFLLNTNANKLFHQILDSLPDSCNKGLQREWISEQRISNPILEFIITAHLSENKSQWSWKKNSSKDRSDLYQRKAITVILEYLVTVNLLSKGVILPLRHGLKFNFLRKITSLTGRFKYREYH